MRENFLQTIMNTASSFSSGNWRRQSLSVQDISKKFGKAHWIAEVRKNLGSDIKKILILSDYSAPIGGIETHIQGSVSTLESAGYEIETLFGMVGNIRWIRYVGLLVSWGNTWYAILLWLKLRKFQPDGVWIHSEVRCIGPIGLLPLLRYSGKIVKTYHDLGYFGAFPTEFTRESQLQGNITFFHFFSRSRGIHRYFFFHILAKFLQVQAIRRIIGSRGLHIVPSDFMLLAVENFIDSPAQAVKISHFSPHQL